MPVSIPQRARPSPTPSPSVSRSSTSTQIELLYNTAAQSFVRRDHIKTLSTLTRLFGLLAIQPGPSSVWYDLTSGSGTAKGVEKEMDDWRAKVLKLYISSWVSLYSDPTTSTSGLTADITKYLQPSPPSDLLLHLHQISLTHSLSPSAPIPILPPSILSTLLLGALRLQPSPIALDTAHRLAEDWLTAVPESLLQAISRDKGYADGEVEEKRKVESAREGYVKVIELFVGEVLVREGEWEMARSFLENEGVMGSKRKENLYRHIRSAQSRPRSAPSSPSNSLVLPSPTSSGILPSRSNGSSTARSRSSSASSSSSEATARPHTADRLSVVGHPTRRSARGRERTVMADRSGKGKEKETEVEADDEKEAIASISTKSSLPSRLFINHSPASSSRVPLRPKPTASGSRSTGSPSGQDGTGSWESLLVLLPKSAQIRLRPILANPWLIAAISIPIPLFTILTAILVIRRKILKKRNVLAGKVLEGAAVGGATVAADALQEVRDRLRLTRGRGVREWLRLWVGWWIKKFLGVWRMGTTITYL